MDTDQTPTAQTNNALFDAISIGAITLRNRLAVAPMTRVSASADQFLTEGVNLRDDGYGGDIACRLRLITEAVHSVRNAVGADFTVGLRISQAKVNDFMHKWRDGEAEAVQIFEALGALPIDYLHTTEFEAWAAAFGSGPSLAALARRHARLPVIANGLLHDAARAPA